MMSPRLATITDAPAIAAVQVAAWREAYGGLMPPEVLAALSVEQRTQRWHRILGEPDPAIGTVAFVWCDPDGTAAAFGSCGLQRSADLIQAGFGGEVQALYVLRAAQRRGVGRALMGTMAGDLAARGVRGVALWVLKGNGPARAFYQALGGHVAGERTGGRGEDAMIAELAYGWPDVAALMASPES